MRLGWTLALILATPSAAAAAPWFGSWEAVPAPALSPAPDRVSPWLSGRTVRQVVRLSAGGSRLRLRLSNEYGEHPLVVGAASVELLDPKGVEVPGSRRQVTFSSAPSNSIPPHAPVVSDPIGLQTPPLAHLRVTVYLASEVGPCACHPVGAAMAEVSPAGDYTGRPFETAATTRARILLTEVEVEAARTRPVVVALGDSITDGHHATAGANTRWPDRLAERLAAQGGAFPAVVNAGLSGNRLLADGSPPSAGQSALARFDQDVLSVPGASHLIILEGINDIREADPHHPPAAAMLISAYRQLIARAHDHAMKAFGGTLLPCGGAQGYSPQQEAVRQAVNRWIRFGGAFDAVIDFDAALRDPARPWRLRADLQSGDWLHPNDVGYRAMGDAVSLALFR
jgi:lysophospholipase L1-like esterase